jgi:hypothetical protein
MSKFQRASKFYPLAMSPRLIADSTGCNYGAIKSAIDERILPAYRPPGGLKRRVCLTEDVINWIRNTWLRS